MLDANGAQRHQPRDCAGNAGRHAARAQILVISGDPATSGAITALVSLAGCTSRSAPDLTQALDAMENGQADLILLDADVRELNQGSPDGFERASRRAPILLLRPSAHGGDVTQW